MAVQQADVRDGGDFGHDGLDHFRAAGFGKVGDAFDDAVWT